MPCSNIFLQRCPPTCMSSGASPASTARSPAVIELAKITMIDAIAMAHGWEMQHDANVVVIGQDVGANGGVFRATAGLQTRFGKDRVQDTPLAEATIAGMSVGLATHGVKPVAEIQFMGFIYPALDQIVNHMSRMRYRTRGRLACPVVIRTPHGGGIHAPEHHSESTETLLCQGADVTLVTWGAMTVETLRAAAELAALGIEAEVLDLATLSPIDSEAILESVAKTGRLVI